MFSPFIFDRDPINKRVFVIKFKFGVKNKNRKRPNTGSLWFAPKMKLFYGQLFLCGKVIDLYLIYTKR